MIKICSYVKRYRRQGRRRVSHVSEYAVMSTDRPEVIYRPGKHGVEHVVISDGQTLASRPGPYRITLDYAGRPQVTMPRGCAQGGV